MTLRIPGISGTPTKGAPLAADLPASPTCGHAMTIQAAISNRNRAFRWSFPTFARRREPERPGDDPAGRDASQRRPPAFALAIRSRLR